MYVCAPVSNFPSCRVYGKLSFSVTIEFYGWIDLRETSARVCAHLNNLDDVYRKSNLKFDKFA